MKIFKRETELVEPVCRFLRGRSFRCQSREVAFYEYRMDLYAYSKTHKSSAAIELKLKLWTRAFEQALVYQLCADYVYIALPATKTVDVDVDLLKHHGLGLIAVYPTRCLECVRPVQSSVTRPHYTKFYQQLLLNGNNK